MTLQFTNHEIISLKNDPSLSEKWLQETIAEDPSILGLGDLDLIAKEKSSGEFGAFGSIAV